MNGGQVMQISISLEQVLFVLVAGLAVVITRWHSTREVRAVLKRIGYFFDDWNGTPERDGVPARAGVMARLQVLERKAESTDRELRTNGGSTIRDAVQRVERAQIEQQATVNRIAAVVSAATVVVPTPAPVVVTAGSVEMAGPQGHPSEIEERQQRGTPQGVAR